MAKGLNGKELGKGIRQKPDGRYEARAMVNGVTIDIYGTNLKELKAQFELEKAKASKNVKCLYGKMNLNEWYEEWFETYKKPSIKSTSVVSMKGKYRNNFGRIIGSKRIADITNYDIQMVVNQLFEEGKAVSTIRDAVGRVRDCLEAAKNNGLIAVNPCFEIIMPKVNEAPTERRFLTLDEQAKFLEVADNKWYREMFYIMFLTGMRVGEVGGLMWKDVDFEKEQISIHQSLTCQYDKGVKTQKLTTPKTYNSYRTIPFMGEAKEMFLAQKEKQEKLKVELGDRWRSEFDDLVFTTTMGSPCNRYIVEKEINKVVKEINENEKYLADKEDRTPVIFERVYPHAIRHTFCSRCFEKGIDMKMTQKLMGHRSITTTSDIYTHLSQIKYDEAIKKFGRMDES